MENYNFFRKFGEEDIMLHRPESSFPGRVNVEELYQAFKIRLLKEVLRASGSVVDDIEDDELF